MKTPVQELILNLTHHIKTQSYEWKRDPIAMLHQIDAMYFDAAIEKEKQMIIDAFDAKDKYNVTDPRFYENAKQYYTKTYKHG